jgi:hypothetical protein
MAGRTEKILARVITRASVLLRLFPLAGRFVELLQDPGGVPADYAEWRDVFGDHAAPGNNRVFADGDTGGDHCVCSDPAVVFDDNGLGGAFLIPDRGMDIQIAVIQAGDANVLGHYYVIADGHGSGQYAADADHDVIPDDDVPDAVVDADKVLYNGLIAELKLSEGHHV